MYYTKEIVGKTSLYQFLTIGFIAIQPSKYNNLLEVIHYSHSYIVLIFLYNKSYKNTMVLAICW